MSAHIEGFAVHECSLSFIDTLTSEETRDEYGVPEGMRAVLVKYDEVIVIGARTTDDLRAFAERLVKQADAIDKHESSVLPLDPVPYRCDGAGHNRTARLDRLPVYPGCVGVFDARPGYNQREEDYL